MTVVVLAALMTLQAPSAPPLAEQRQAEELLNSADITRRAWGVFYAGQLRIPALNDRLVEQLVSLTVHRDADPESVERALIHAVFDSLIVSGAQVPEENLVPFAESWRDEVLILLARQQPSDDALFQIRRADLTEAQWLLVNNLLLQKKSPRFFSKILREVAITHKVLIVDGDGIGSGSGGSSGSVGCGIRLLPKGFPPVGLHQLITHAEAGATVVAKGPRDVYYRRTVVPTNGQAGWSVQTHSWDAQRERLAYLAQMTRSEISRIQQLLSPVSSIHWQNGMDLTREVDLLLERQANEIQYWFDEAKSSWILSDLDPIRLQVAAEVEDQRQGATNAAFRVVRDIELR